MFGLRADGKRVKGLDPIQKIMPHIMAHRHDSQNTTSYDLPCEPFDAFIKSEREKGESINYMHLMIAGIVRTIALFPRLNRFIMNGRIFQRRGIFISFVVKKNLSADASDSVVKLEFTGQESLYEIRDKIDNAIRENNKVSANNGTDSLVHFLTIVPNFLIKFAVGTLKFLDKHGLLVNGILKLSPFHTSCFITNLKSIKGPSIHHHLYDFGNTGLFFAMGKEGLKPVVRDGEIVVGKIMPVDIVTDERFCDGFYFVNALKQLKKFYDNPSLLCERLEELPADIQVVNSRKLNKQKKKEARALEKAQKKEEKNK